MKKAFLLFLFFYTLHLFSYQNSGFSFGIGNNYIFKSVDYKHSNFDSWELSRNYVVNNVFFAKGIGKMFDLKLSLTYYRERIQYSYIFHYSLFEYYTFIYTHVVALELLYKCIQYAGFNMYLMVGVNMFNKDICYSDAPLNYHEIIEKKGNEVQYGIAFKYKFFGAYIIDLTLFKSGFQNKMFDEIIINTGISVRL